VLNGCDPNTVFGFIAGAQACIWGGANYMPHESVRLFELVKKNDITGAMELWSRMIPSLLCIWRGNYVPKVKAASRQRGFDGGGVRAPLQDLSVDEARELGPVSSRFVEVEAPCVAAVSIVMECEAIFNIANAQVPFELNNKTIQVEETSDG
jgi:dihydrodipicolinate synthase/N-acetylneuraminate lyase